MLMFNMIWSFGTVYKWDVLAMCCYTLLQSQGI